MYLFNNDYNEICHPEILRRLADCQSVQMPGYGTDYACENAANIIRDKCCAPSADVHFLLGGTQTNLTVIAAALRPHQAVLTAETGHISVHETGAIEATGHKVIALQAHEGKISAETVKKAVLEQRLSPDAEHLPQPKLVYISNPTEYGTVYSLQELSALSELCEELGLLLYADGARLGYGLAAADNNVTLADMASLCDAFYIGGTKVGAMFGEAVVITNNQIAEDFRYIMKQRGGLLAKGWLLGIQFSTLFEDDLYFKIASKANKLADQIRGTIQELGYKEFVSNRTNQVFAVLPNELLDNLGEGFTYSAWERYDDQNTVARFCTSWATKEEAVDALCAELIRLSK